MSVQFGRWNTTGEPIDSEYLENVSALLCRYAPDGSRTHRETRGDVAFLCHAFHTTRESWQDVQPLVLESDTVLTWDGRLDNREDILATLGLPINDNRADVSLVGALYERLGVSCFRKLLGDWALALWDPSERVLILARDFIGIKHLYYSLNPDTVQWSTVLEALVGFSDHSLVPNEEYVAGWLGHFPRATVSPYVGIQVVPPASYVRIRSGCESVHTYWDFDSSRTIRYRNEIEYEEQFRVVFRESVRRRLRSSTPVLAELSGGMDSSSIVCTADCLSPHDPVDTISYYIDADQNWNELPYANAVEKKRNRAGTHIDIGHDSMVSLWRSGSEQVVDPNSSHGLGSGDRALRDCLRERGGRVLLSGIGGDEVLGGIPNPVPELAELLGGGNFRLFTKQLLAWATTKKIPVYFLLAEIGRAFLPLGYGRTRAKQYLPTWLQPQFVAQHRNVLRTHGTRLTWLGARPSFQDNLHSLDILRRQLACFSLPYDPPLERRYPYLDRDLLEFLFALPPHQLLRPNERRSLMRRAFKDLLPPEILNRRRKAFVTRHPLPQAPSEWAVLHEIARNLHPATRQFVSPDSFDQALTNAEHGRQVPLIPLLRTVALDRWLRSISGAAPEPKQARGVQRSKQIASPASATISQLKTIP
jgi:asparagine synthase (glutamine-hydrolysing)